MALIFEVKVIPSSGSFGFFQDKNGDLKCYLKSAPEKGQANKELIKNLARLLKIPQNDVELLAGETIRKKKIKIHIALTLDQLKQIVPGNPYIDHWYEALSEICPDYDIDTPQRIAAFLAQCAHESGGFKAIKENLNYRPQTLVTLFKKYFDLPTAERYCAMPNKQEAIANRIYANRMGNGIETSGDGFKFRGRGAIQLTGKENYTKFATSIGKSLDETVAYLETLEGAVESACWFWSTHGLNATCDADDIVSMTKKINGGTIGLEDRKAHYEHALHVLGA